MATFLYRIGRFAYRRAWRVIGAWILVLAAILGGGLALGGQFEESFSIPGTESQLAIDKLNAVFPQASGAAVETVFQVPDGESVEDAQYKDAIEETISAIEGIDGVAAAISPFSEYAANAVSDNEETAIARVQLEGASTDVTQETIDALTATGEIGRDAGMTVAFGGQVFQDTTFGLTIVEVFGVLFAGVVLVITFGSLLAAGMPLLMALVGVGVAIGGILLAAAFGSVSSTAPMLAVMLGLAVGIDYSLFILSRHRQQLARGVDPEESVATAVATAGGAVVFAGITVIIALLGLLIVGIPFLSTMGVATAFAVLIAMLIAVTLLPAVLGLIKGRMAPKPGSRADRRALADDDAKPTMGRRWVNTVLKAPIVAVVLVVGVLGTLAIPAFSLDLNLPTGAAEPAGSTQREAYELIADGFGPGYNGPLVVVVDITQTTDIVNDLDTIRAELDQLDDVAFVSQGLPNPSVDTAIMQVIPESAPDDPETKELVQNIRDLAPKIEDELGTPITVTGQTAVTIDISNRLSDALVPFALIVVGLSIILLMMVFRSIFVPIKAAIGFLLSVFAAIGATVAVFQWGWFSELLHVEHVGPILSFLPILLMAVLFGLAMDYEVFLVSGMREEFVKTGKARSSIVHGFQHSARVVTAAALIMFFVFFSFVPEGAGPIKGIAFALAIGVFFDAFLVRMTLVPAAMALAGKAAWYLPKWLGRLLPNVDVEGESLRAHLDDLAWARQQNSALTADDAYLGLPAQAMGPLNFAIDSGAVVTVQGDASARRVFAASLAGRLGPVAGRLQLLGSPLPSERSRALRRVGLIDVGAGQRHDLDRTVGEVLSERLELSLPWYRARFGGDAERAWIDRINAALRATGTSLRPIDAETSISSLSALGRATVLAASVLTERPAVLIVDLGDALPVDARGRNIAQVLAALAPADTTIVLAAGDAVNAASEALIGARASTAIALPAPAAAPTRIEEVQEDEVAR
ncbi:RND superfamily putative drug exporter [Microterricola gilva]|uniref:RND superfamily putative drug exporter n=1 Tax=Microterricola gilva TaxID=393267 RepID=A0A4V2GAK6_9MICO|nr:MMPL family transporter [Microterricola gilva]RZU64626.1 RND superfamily putative drug exporter [Microterricola gilva]